MLLLFYGVFSHGDMPKRIMNCLNIEEWVNGELISCICEPFSAMSWKYSVRCIDFSLYIGFAYVFVNTVAARKSVRIKYERIFNFLINGAGLLHSF